MTPAPANLILAEIESRRSFKINDRLADRLSDAEQDILTALDKITEAAEYLRARMLDGSAYWVVTELANGAASSGTLGAEWGGLVAAAGRARALCDAIILTGDK